MTQTAVTFLLCACAALARAAEECSSSFADDSTQGADACGAAVSRLPSLSRESDCLPMNRHSRYLW